MASPPSPTLPPVRDLPPTPLDLQLYFRVVTSLVEVSNMRGCLGASSDDPLPTLPPVLHTTPHLRELTSPLCFRSVTCPPHCASDP